MAQIEQSQVDNIGVKFSGSAQTGHKVELARENALGQIFGTPDDMQAGSKTVKWCCIGVET